MVSDHYYNEAKLMNEILESNTTKEERKELKEFMLNHPYSKVVNSIKEIKHKSL
ncbi:MAG TPA: hypothetical protein VJ583_08595 [Nitrososphaeraceae archaeon]|jgi:hypothetical protein|nr:hypothetical protein [Nitrososphaeraceae archaeon]